MIGNRKVCIISDADDKKIVLINDIVFKGKRNVDWNEVKSYLKGYVGDCYQVEESAEIIYIGTELPDEYTGSESRKTLTGANAKNGWYRYDVRFGIPVYEENVLVRYNIYGARLLVNHAENGKKYLYDILAIKKKRASHNSKCGENPFLTAHYRGYSRACQYR